MVKLGEIDLAEIKLREASWEYEAIGQPANAFFTLTKGWLSFERADLEGVRNALHLMRTEQLGIEEGALDLEATAFVEQGRFSEARATYERLVTSRKTRSVLLDALDAQLDLCALSCREGHPLEGLDCFGKNPVPPEMEVYVSSKNLYLTSCLYETRDFQGVEKAARAAQAEAQDRGWTFARRLVANTYLMRVGAARAQPDRAIATLRTDLAEAEAKKMKRVAFEVALALGEVELRAGRPEGRTRLRKLEQEARSKEFFRIANLARGALDWTPTAQ